MITNIKFQIENPALLNSRFVFDETLYLDMNFYQLNLTRGSSYLPLPERIAKKKAVTNPQKGGQECFKWSIIAADKWMKIDSHPERVSNLRKFEDDYDWTGLEFPVPTKSISKFETRNDISVDVLAIEGKEIYILKKGQSMDKQINLLLISEDGVNHYTAIKSLSRLLRSSNTKHHSSIEGGVTSTLFLWLVFFRWSILRKAPTIGNLRCIHHRCPSQMMKCDLVNWQLLGGVPLS